MQNYLLVLLLFLMPLNLLAEDQVVTESNTKTLVWPDGTKYVGGVVNGKRTGKGTIFWQDGTRFVGQFENDMRNGPGTMILSDGTVYTGYFKDDELVDSPATSITAVAEPVTEAAKSLDQPAEAETTISSAPAPPVSESDEVQVASEASTPESAEGPATESDASDADSTEDAPLEVLFDDQVTSLTDEVKQQLMETIDLWQAAWSDKNVPQYLSNYSDEFQLPRKLTRSNWEAMRRSRLTRPQYINLKIVYEKFELVETNVADVFFKQTYRSNLYRDVTNKVLRLEKEDQVWKILQERSR
jgi:MORN repeat